MTMEWATSALASARRPAPRARAIAEDTPPPMPPADIICMSIATGKTSATPASASVPRKPTKYVSITLTSAWTVTTIMVGAANRSNVAAIGPRSINSCRWSGTRADTAALATAACAGAAIEVLALILASGWLVTISIIVTCKQDVNPLSWIDGPFVSAEELSGRPHARPHRGALDAPRATRPLPARTPAVPGLPGVARWRRAEHAVGAPQGHGGERPGRPAPLQRAPSPPRVPSHREGKDARTGGEGAARVGTAPWHGVRRDRTADFLLRATPAKR